MNVTQIAVARDNTVIYTITDDIIRKSTNGGTHFINLSLPPSFSRPPRMVAVAPDSSDVVMSVDNHAGGSQFGLLSFRRGFSANHPQRNIPCSLDQETGLTQLERTVQHNADGLATDRSLAQAPSKLRVIGKGRVDTDQNSIGGASQSMDKPARPLIADPSRVPRAAGNASVQCNRRFKSYQGQSR